MRQKGGLPRRMPDYESLLWDQVYESTFISTELQILLTVTYAEEEAISWVDVSRHLSGRTNKDSRRRWTKIKDNFRRGVWSREEDESLREAVERFGQRWALITEVVETRSPDRRYASTYVHAAQILIQRFKNVKSAGAMR